MLSPSDRSTNRMARFVIRTHAVPMPASTNGSSASATATSATPTHAPAGCFFQSRYCRMEEALGAVAHALAQEARWTEDEDRDQHQEREHVLVVRTEQREVGVVDT